MRKIFAIILFLGCLFPAALVAQFEMEGVPVRMSDTTWCDQGFDFYIGGGMFSGNKFNANYYNGSNLNESNLYYLFKNEYWNEALQKTIAEAYKAVGLETASLELDPGSGIYNWENNYKISMLVALGVRYKIRNGWGLSLSYSFSRLTSSAQCLLTTENPNGNMTRQPVMSMVGKEDRSTIDFTVNYLFSKVHKVVKPFIELGVQFNYARAKSFDAVLLDQKGHPVGDEYTLLDQFNGQGYYPGAQTYDVIYGGPGFGFSGAAGLKIAINKTVSLDPTFYCYMGRTGIYQMKNCPVQGYGDGNKFTFNWGVLVRVVMSDYFFSKR